MRSNKDIKDDDLNLSNLIDKKIDLKWNHLNKISSFTQLSHSSLLREKFKIFADTSKTCITSKKQNKVLVPPFIISAFDTMYLFSLKAVDIIEQSKEFLDYYHQNLKDLKFKVYLDLKKKNYFVLSGFKYGCDFIVYIDDPNFVHSDFLVSCFKKEDDIECKTIIANERIGVATRKKLIYAFVSENQDDDKIEYLNFSWVQI